MSSSSMFFINSWIRLWLIKGWSACILIIYESFKSTDNFIVDLEKRSYTDTLGSYDSGNKKTPYRIKCYAYINY